MSDDERGHRGDRVQRAGVEREVRVEDSEPVMGEERRHALGSQRSFLMPDVPLVDEPVVEDESLRVKHRPEADADDQPGERDARDSGQPS